MAIAPRTYAAVGEALFNKDWVYQMRALLDIRKTVAEQIGYHAARGLPFDMPDRIEAPLRGALIAKIEQCRRALEQLEADQSSGDQTGSPEPRSQS
jgi:hypothetical protein